ncbi:hypothetical protein [Burkholderia ubonensis]|uniref:hypothetical protein n=1 Tax=Burkholderia ubonensis TaxID=101571 RepID=UPI000ABB27CC|nr:hypothetical protein [Burkholderia ubonensis]
MAHDPYDKQPHPAPNHDSETDAPHRDIYDSVRESWPDRESYVAPRDQYTPDPPDNENQ